MDIPEYNVKNRIRKVDLTKLTPEQAEQLGDQIGAKIREKVDQTVEEVNNFLKIYGMKAKMQIALEPLQEEPKGE